MNVVENGDDEVAPASSASDLETSTEVESDTDATSRAAPARLASAAKKGREKTKVFGGNDNEDEDEDSDSEDDDYVPEVEEDLSEDEDEESNQASKPESLSVKLSTDEDEKNRGDKLWTEFLKDVELEKTKKPEIQNGNKRVTKVYDFAGERVTIIRGGNSKMTATNGNSPVSTFTSSSSSSPSTQVDDLLIRKPSLPGLTPAPRSKGISFLSGDPAKIGLAGGKRGLAGLQSVINALKEKKQKMGTLEKSRYDWENFKEAEGIDEELKVQVKGRDGYLERQEFLQRTDLRQFEIEKNMRVKTRRNP